VPLTAAIAQQNGSIAGLVTDSTGSVPPGVTVEASSPALIEKARTVLTDSNGLYRLVDLRPGVYAVSPMGMFWLLAEERSSNSSGPVEETGMRRRSWSLRPGIRVATTIVESVGGYQRGSRR
jgi:hypothetical protein